MNAIIRNPVDAGGYSFAEMTRCLSKELSADFMRHL